MNFDSDNLLQILPMIGLYAETHFRFGGWTPSLLFKKEPELIFDMPRRIDKGKDVPLFLFINDIKKFPLEIQKITVALSQDKKSRIVLVLNDIKKYEITHNFSNNSPTYLFLLPAAEFNEGYFSLACKIEVKKGKKIKTFLNNNLRTSEKKPLIGFYAKDKLPGSNECLYGDMHVHSQYTESHVEFCPPIKAIDLAAYSLGLNFLTITDHSYDLSCSKDNYLKPVEEPERWNLFQKEINDTSFKTVVIAGEEISSINSERKIIHLGSAGVKTFIEGNADGARKKVSKLSSSLSIKKASEIIHKDNGLAFAAHPGARSGFLQRLLLKRGKWKEEDITDSIDAFQAVNNGFRSGWYIARKIWINKLLHGKKIPLIAGNDSHGDFNRYISLKIPFLLISDIDDRYLGYGKTGIYSNKTLTANDIISFIKEGKTFVTTGPYIEITDTNGKVSISNEKSGNTKFIITAKSTEEFGKIDIIRIFQGNLNKKEEILLTLKNNLNSFNTSIEIDIKDNFESCYLRAEVICEDIRFGNIKEPAMAATSPVYLY